MANEQQQRIVRRAGPDPAEAEKHDKASRSRQAMAQEEAELEAEQKRSPDEPTPLAEDPADDAPRPRR